MKENYHIVKPSEIAPQEGPTDAFSLSVSFLVSIDLDEKSVYHLHHFIHW